MKWLSPGRTGLGPTRWWLLLAAVVVRAFLLPIPNTDDDAVFPMWSRALTVDGFHRIYDTFDRYENPLRECQYPPGYLYMLWAVGNVYRWGFSPGFDPVQISLLILLRIPIVLADLLLAWLVFRALRRWFSPRIATLGLAAYLFSPTLILDATIVTQIDTVQSLLVVGTILLLIADRTTLAIACLALASFTKPQSAVLVPLVLFVAYRKGGLRPIVTGGLASVGVILLLCLPFLLHGRGDELYRTLTNSVGVAPFLSLNAYNAWWLFSGGDGWRPDTGILFGGVTYRTFGLLLLGAAVLLPLYRIHRRVDRESVLIACAWTTFAFFMLSTEMTERYVVVTLPLLLLLAPHARGYRILFAVLSVTTFVNLYTVFPLVLVTPWDALQLPHSNFYHYLHPANGPPLPVLTPWSETGLHRASLVVAAVHCVVLGALAWQLWPRRTPADGTASGSD